MANLTDTTMFKKLNSQTAMYDADNVDFLIKGLSGTYAEKTSVYTKTEADSKFATKEDISSVYHFKGSVETYQDLKALPTAELKIGDTYNVDESGKNYAWTGVTSAYDEGWDVLGGTFDLSNYYTKDQTNGLLSAKVDKVEGMGLSHNDFTDEAVAKVDGAFQTSGGTVSGIAFFNRPVYVSGDLTVSQPEANTSTVVANDRFVIATTGQNFKETQYQNGQVFFDNGTVESTISIPAKSGTFALTSDIDSAVSGKVDKVEGMGLSHNDFTDSDVSKLAQAYGFTVSGGFAQGGINHTNKLGIGALSGNFAYMNDTGLHVGYKNSRETQYEDSGVFRSDGYSAYFIGLPTTSGTLALTSDIDSAVSDKADSTAFGSLSGLQTINASAFDVEEIVTKYNTLVTMLSGIAVGLNQ